MIPTDLSADTRALADHLATVPVGELATIARMSAVIGRDVDRHRHVLYAAIRVAQRETGAVFACERGAGYRRLSVEEVVQKVGSTARDRIRGTARRARKTLTAGTRGANDLAPAMQRKAAAEVSALALLEHLARDAVARPANDGPQAPTPVAITAKTMLARIAG